MHRGRRREDEDRAARDDAAPRRPRPAAPGLRARETTCVEVFSADIGSTIACGAP